MLGELEKLKVDFDWVKGRQPAVVDAIRKYLVFYSQVAANITQVVL